MRTSSTSSSSWSAKSAGCLSVRLQENNHRFELAQTLLLSHQPGEVSVCLSICLSVRPSAYRRHLCITWACVAYSIQTFLFFTSQICRLLGCLPTYLPACLSVCLSCTMPGTHHTHSAFQSTKSAACPEGPPACSHGANFHV